LDVLEFIVERLEIMISEEAEVLASGSAKDYSEYCGVVGKTSGFKLAIQVIEQARETLARDEDLEGEGMIDVENSFTQ
jgi:hypothetical protein